MGKEYALYQLMDIRMNGVMNGIVSNDGEYQSIIRKSDEYSDRLDEMDLSKEVRLQRDAFGKMSIHRIKSNGFQRVIHMKKTTE